MKMLSVKAQLDWQSESWRLVLDKVKELNPNLATMYPSITARDAVLQELERLYRADKEKTNERP